MVARSRVVSRFLAGALLLTASSAVPSGLPLTGEAAEAFLRDAAVVDSEMLGTGITRSQRVVLRHGEVTARAIFKTIDQYRSVMRFSDGTFETGFHDSYKNELAAWELDQLIGLDLVPPTVERKIGSKRGSLQLWVEDVTSEGERRLEGRSLSDPARWQEQMNRVHLFHNLTYNTDHRNISNILIDDRCRIYLIDHSRAFRNQEELLAAKDLTRFSRPLLDSIRTLDEEVLKERLGRWLTRKQIRSLLKRRDRIVARAEELAAEKGAEQVFYP